MKKLVGTLVLAVAFFVSTKAQVTNGDFSNSTNGWTYFFPPSNHLIPQYGIMQIDIDGTGPLSNSPAFYANVGDDALLNLNQNVYLSGDLTYTFHADLASIPYSLNLDGGTISVYVGQTNIASYSFGSFSSLQTKYASITTNYFPGSSGTQTLSIHFSRGFGWGGVGNTPTDVIDNISLSPVPISLNLQCLGFTVILTWTNSVYSLQAAPAITGTYTNIPGATSPFTNTIAGTTKFFRLIAN